MQLYDRCTHDATLSHCFVERVCLLPQCTPDQKTIKMASSRDARQALGSPGLGDPSASGEGPGGSSAGGRGPEPPGVPGGRVGGRSYCDAPALGPTGETNGEGPSAMLGSTRSPVCCDPSDQPSTSDQALNPDHETLTKAPCSPCSRESPGPGNEPSPQPGNGDLRRVVASFDAYSHGRTNVAQLYAIFAKLGIETRTAPYLEPPRPPNMRGIFCKNVFLKDRKGQFYLVICNETREIDLKKLKALVGAHRNFSFGSPDDLDRKLGLTPGAVTPFGLINDVDGSVRFIVDRSLVAEAERRKQRVNFHPIVDYLTTLLTMDDLMKFAQFSRHDPEILDL